MQAATLMHELGHTAALRHGGLPNDPNCKPNYQSVMSYLYQVRGLLDLSKAILRWTTRVRLCQRLNEASLIESAGLGVPHSSVSSALVRSA